MKNPFDFTVVFMDASRPAQLVRNEEELETILHEMQQDTYPRSINLRAPNGDILTIALGAEFGFVQYENSGSASPSYLMAFDPSRIGPLKRYRNVDAGGTPTPVPEYACLPPEQVFQIVMDYARNLEVPSTVQWRQI